MRSRPPGQGLRERGTGHSYVSMKNRMRLPNAEHTSRPWRIHEIAPDFRLEDVWALPTPGGPDDFPLLVEGATALEPSSTSSRVGQALFALRWKLGALFSWDEHAGGPGGDVPTLRDRLP